MNKSIRRTAVGFVAGSVFAGVMLFGTSSAWAQSKAGDVNQQLVGSWKVLAYRSQLEGQSNWTEPLGPNPKGYVVLDARRAIHADCHRIRPQAPTNDADRVALLGSMNAFSGRYTVDNDQLHITVDTSWAEAHTGERQKQVRFFKLEGDKLTWRTPPQIGARSVAAGAVQGKVVTEWVMEREK